MVASEVAAAFAAPSSSLALVSGSTAAALPVTVKAITRRTLLPPTAWGAAVRAAAGTVAVRSLYLWSGMSSIEATATAAALSASAGSAFASTAGSAKLGADAITAMLTFALWTGCLAAGARLGSVLQPVGITGGIACGKSTVSEMLSSEQRRRQRLEKGKDEKGRNIDGKPAFAIIDVDKIGHDILIPGKLVENESAYENVVSEFGTAILSTSPPTPDEKEADGGDDRPRIERRSLGDVIFRDPSKRRRLNKLTHPLISKIMLKRVVTWNVFAKANQTMNKLVAVDIPLLFEVGLKMRILFGLVVVVACKPSTQLDRLMERNKDLTQ